MATSQHAFQPNTQVAQHFAKFKSLRPEPTTIDLEQVSVSQLLGRDYVFINAKEAELPVNNPSAMQSLLGDVIQQLELSETHTVAVSVNELSTGSLSFVRHDITWCKHKVCRIENVSISQSEQHEFMEMIWRCSTAASIA